MGRQAGHHRHLDVEYDDLDVVASERRQGRLAVAHRSRHLDRRILLQRARQQAADDRRVIDHHDAVRISSVSAGAAGGGLRFRHQMRPTWTNFDSMMSLSKGFIMYSLAPASIAVLMCSMSDRKSTRLNSSH